MVGVSVGMVYGLVALGISLIFSGLDIIHFAHGEIYMLGAFIGLTIAQLTGLNYVVTLLLAMLCTGVFGMVIERVFYRRLTSGGGGYTVAGMGMIICGFGMSIVLQNLANLIWGAKAQALPDDFGRPIELGNVMVPRTYLWIIARRWSDRRRCTSSSSARGSASRCARSPPTRRSPISWASTCR